MLKILAALVLGVAILLPAAAAFAGEEGNADTAGHDAAPVQIEINSAPAQPNVSFSVDDRRE
jgi:hypothetical protein